LTTKNARGERSNRRTVKIESKVQPFAAATAGSAEENLTPDHVALKQLMGQVADGLDSLQHHLNVFQRTVTASGRNGRAKDNVSKASKQRARAIEQAR
jgi:hypothetical protein